MSGFKYSEHKAKKDKFWEEKWEGLDLQRQRAGKEVVPGGRLSAGMGGEYTSGAKCRSRGKWRKGEKVHLKVQLLTCPRQEHSESPNGRGGQGFLICAWAAGREPKQRVWFGAPGR